MNRTVLVILVMFLGLSASLGVLSLTQGHAWGDDFAGYIMQAQSIVRGNEQDFVNKNAFTITKSSFLIGPVAYPWGYPLILAPVYAASGLNLISLKMPDLFFFLSFLVCLFFFYQRNMSSKESLLLMGAFAFHPVFLAFLDQILSDIPYLFFSLLALLVMDAYFINGNGASRNVFGVLLLGALFYATFFIRTPGLILFATYMTMLIIRFWAVRWNRQHIEYVLRDTIILCLVFGVLWLLSDLAFPGGQKAYISEYSSFTLDTVKVNSIYYFWLFGHFLDQLIYWKPIFFLLLAFFSIGVCTGLERDKTILAYFGISILVLITYPSLNGVRFIFPLLPLFIYFSFQGMKEVAFSLKAGYRRVAYGMIYVFWSMMIAFFLITSVINAYSNWYNKGVIAGPFDSYSLATYQFIENNTSPDSIIVFFKPRIMRLMTNRNTLAIDNCKQLKMGDFDVIDKPIGADGQVPNEAVSQCSIQMKQVYENPEFVIYQILKKK